MLELLLAGYAAAVAAIGTWWLPRASWPLRMPRLGIAAWQVLTVTFVASALVVGVLIAVPCLPASLNYDVAAELRAHYASADRLVTGPGDAGRGGPPGLGHRIGDGNREAPPRPS